MKKHLFGKVTFIIAFGLSLIMQGCKDKEERNEEKGITGITGITKGSVDLAIPPGTPPDEVWRYGLGFPFQVAPGMAGLFVNIRKEGAGSIDFEIGTDVILFNDLENISAANAIELSRYEKETHENLGETITIKGPVVGGFVPLGAKLSDGSDHPHAGTGFGMCWAITHVLDQDGKFDYLSYKERNEDLFQFAYDGENFQILKKERVKTDTLLPDWNLAGSFITNAIPDGSDLLFVMGARRKTGDKMISGVTRWRHGSDGWRPISFVPVAQRRDNDKGKWKDGGEPSLIRDMDGSLLFSARSAFNPPDTTAGFDIAIWRSMDNGQNWKQVIYRKECRSRSPISIDQAVDGTPFIVANYPPLMRRRDILCYWPLNAGRTDLGELKIVRDARGEFGPAPSGSWWRIDHPTSANVQLADRKWHSVLVYRIVDNGEIEGDADPTPQTGCYIEEVYSRGEPIPTWSF